MKDTTRSNLFTAYWLLVAAALAGCLALLFLYTPTDVTDGPVQKIFYVHLPVAINTFAAALVACIGGVGYLWRRRMKWDSLSAAAATVAAALATATLVSGMIWARKAWGHWWVWTPRLTLSLMLWLLYVVYVLVRASIESRQRRALIGAVYAVAAFIDAPLVYFSARLMPNQLEVHPRNVPMAPEMRLTLGLWFIPVTLLTAGLIVALHRRAQRRLGAELARAQSAASDGDNAPK